MRYGDRELSVRVNTCRKKLQLVEPSLNLTKNQYCCVNNMYVCSYAYMCDKMKKDIYCSSFKGRYTFIASWRTFSYRNWQRTLSRYNADISTDN